MSWRTIRYANFKSQQTRLPAMNTHRGSGKIFDPLVNLASLSMKVAQRRGKQHTTSTIYSFISFNTLQTCYSRQILQQNRLKPAAHSEERAEQTASQFLLCAEEWEF